MTADRDTALRRACVADRGIRALDAAVTALCATARTLPGATCAGCVWDRIIKPLATPLVGWERGHPPLSASDPTTGLAPVNVAELLVKMDARRERRMPATSEAERWLRTQEAWDAVTGAWLERLRAADPAEGHGIACLAEAS